MTTTLSKRLMSLGAIALMGLAFAATPVHFGPLTTGTAFAGNDSPSDSDNGIGNDPPGKGGNGNGGSNDGSGNGNPGKSGPGNS